MYTGKTIRNIRLNKNIKSKTAYKDIFSRSVATDFEKGISDTTVNKFLNILDNLHVTLEEFESFYSNEENKNNYYTNGYIHAFQNKDVIKMKELIKSANHDYEITGNEKYNHFQALMLLLLSEFHHDNSKNESSVATLQKYLMSCNTWGYYEVTLFTNTVQYYSNDLIDNVYKHAINIIKNLPSKNRYQNDLTILICNILEVKILSKNIKSANYYLSELQNKGIYRMNNTYQIIMIKLFTSILNYIKSNENKNEVDKVLEVLEFLGLYALKNKSENLYKKVVELYG